MQQARLARPVARIFLIVGLTLAVLIMPAMTSFVDSAQARPAPVEEEPYRGPGDYYKPVQRYVPPTRGIVFNKGDASVLVGSALRKDGTNQAMSVRPGTSSANRIDDVERIIGDNGDLCIKLSRPGMDIIVWPGEVQRIGNGVYDMTTFRCGF